MDWIGLAEKAEVTKIAQEMLFLTGSQDEIQIVKNNQKQTVIIVQHFKNIERFFFNEK